MRQAGSVRVSGCRGVRSPPSGASSVPSLTPRQPATLPPCHSQPIADEQLARLRRIPNPQEIRQRLGLTQLEFSKQFQIALGTLRDWEQGTRRPDIAGKAYLRVIAAAPDAVRRILRKEGESTYLESLDVSGLVTCRSPVERSSARGSSLAVVGKRHDDQ